MASAKAYVYTCKEVEFRIGGEEYDVSEISMVLGISAIPEIRLSIAPDKSTDEKTHVNKLSLSAVKKALDELLHKAEELTRCDFKVEIEKHDASTGEKVATQKLDLKDWILCSAGLEDVTTTSPFCLSVDIKHPIYELALKGGFWSNLDVCPNLHEDEVQSSEDVLDAGVVAYEMLNEALESHPLDMLFMDEEVPPSQMDPDEIMDVIKTKVEDVPELLDKYLEWRPELGGGSEGFPLFEYLDDTGQEAMREIVATSWLYSEGSAEHSVWDSMLSVLSSMHLAILPYFWQEKLPIAPRFPWRPVDLTIKEDDSYNVLLPGGDPCPIFGLCATQDSVGGSPWDMVTSSKTGNELEDIKSSATSLAFVPDQEYNMNGKFMTVPIPSWLSSVRSKAASYNDQTDEHPKMDENKPPEEDQGGGENEATKHANTCEMMYLSSVFAESFKQFVEARVNCPFLPRAPKQGGSERMKTSDDDDGGDWLVPSKVVSFETEDGPIFEGYVTSVSHSISMVSGNAVTNVSMSHCRPEGGYELMEGYGGKHPMYSSGGGGGGKSLKKAGGG